MFNFETSSIRVMTSIIFSTIKTHPLIIDCPLIVQYLSQKGKRMFYLPKYWYDLTKLYNIFLKKTILLVIARVEVFKQLKEL